MLNFFLLVYVEFGFLKRYIILVQTHTTYFKLNAVVTLVPTENKIKFDWIGKL